MPYSSRRPAPRAALAPVLLIAVLSALLLAASSASAATFAVTTTSDGPGPCNPGSCTLRGAVEAADAAGEPSTVTVPAGEYRLTEEEEGSDLQVEAGVTIQGAGAEVVEIVQAAECACRVFYIDGAPVTISGVTISGGFVTENPRGPVGGDVLFRPAAGGPLRLVGDVIESGVAAEKGGGVFSEEGELEIVETTLADNGAGFDGGGLFAENDSSEPIVLERDTFVGNGTEGAGGGAYFEFAEAFVTNSTFNQNGTPVAVGGAIAAFDSRVSLLNDTLAGDIGGELPPQLQGVTRALGQARGSEVYGVSGDEFKFVNTIFGPAGEGETGSECALDATVVAEHDIDAGESCEVGGTPGSMVNTDPQLEPLAMNGGPTETMAIRATSPANEAGNPAACPATDQRNVSRPLPPGTPCDIGAYEFGEPPAPPPVKSQPPATCSTAAAGATSFKPQKRPGHVLPGVRVRLSTPQPSQVSVQATLIWKDGSKTRSTALGSLDVKINHWRRVRFVIPSALREKLPLGTRVKVKLQITTQAAGCTGASSTKTLNVRVVNVFPNAVQAQRPR